MVEMKVAVRERGRKTRRLLGNLIDRTHTLRQMKETAPDGGSDLLNLI